MAVYNGHVLLTGANGFIASQILSILLDRGFLVTATVRSIEKAEAIIKTHPSWEGKVDFVEVADLTSAASFDSIFVNAKVPFKYVIHTASPVAVDPDNIQKGMIEPAVMGTTAILESAHHHGKSLKRFILLSSVTAVFNPFQDITQKGRPYTETDWNPATAQDAIKAKDPFFGYYVSKTQGEAAAWEFIRANSPSFDLVVINPDLTTGPMLHPLSGPTSINGSNYLLVAGFLDGTYSDIGATRFPLYHFVDVRDVARSHVDALTNPAAGGQRILLTNSLVTPQLVANIIRKNFPDLRDRVAEGNPAQILPDGVHPTGWDARASLDILAKGTKEGEWKYIDLEASVVDTVRSMTENNLI